MQCPVCRNEMEQGYLQCSSRLCWVKSPHEVFLIPKEGEVLLGFDMNLLTLPAHICKSCKKVLIDYATSNYQEK